MVYFDWKYCINMKMFLASLYRVCTNIKLL
nr:MAG TPA: hypothetical protein [Bacteriophage sp.]